MRFCKLLSAALLCTMLSACGTHKDDVLFTGRTYSTFSDDGAVRMVYPGTKINANFEGTGVAMKASAGYFMVTVDNSAPKKIHFTPDNQAISVASNLPKGKHTVEAMLCYEGYNDKPEFKGYEVTDGKLLKAPARPKVKLEFIGNSITCGYGTEARKTDGSEAYNDSTENHYYSFAQVVTRRLKAETMVVARSGIGVYRNYGGKREGDDNIMPQWYDYTLLYDDAQKWNFRQFTPQVICLNLGTNDLSTDNFDIDRYAANYKAFVKHLRKVQPKAKIVMVTGSMLNGSTLDLQKQKLDNVLAELKAEGISDLYRFDFTPQDGSLGYGADWHPSIAQHEKMANELEPFLRQLLGL